MSAADDDAPSAPPGPGYYRCGHCKGFYETTFARCKWCEYQTPVLAAGGDSPQVFPDRAGCRAIQVAEYRALPAEAHDDSMGPPPRHLDLVCSCLHCGQDGHAFEAVEMRWMENEQMWACPCTTCGGRGFTIDIHPLAAGWHCCDCDHYFAPADGHYYRKNAVCPKCGSRTVDGMFEDSPEEEAEWEKEFGEADALPTDAEFADDPVPWDDDDDDDDDDEDDADPFARDADPEDPYGLMAGMSWRESDSGELPGGAAGDVDAFAFDDLNSYDRKLPDDIDFPHPRREKRDKSNDDFDDDDIPF